MKQKPGGGGGGDGRGGGYCAKVATKVSSNPSLCFIIFVVPSCTMCATTSESNPSMVADVGLGSVKFRLVKRSQHLEIALVFAPSFLVYLHDPRACSIIPHIGLSGPCALRQRRVGKSKCHQ